MRHGFLNTINIAMIIMLLTLMTLSVGSAKSLKCTVVGVDGAILPEGTNNQVVLECDDIDGIKLGDEVKVKLPKKKDTAIEGC